MVRFLRLQLPDRRLLGWFRLAETSPAIHTIGSAGPQGLQARGTGCTLAMTRFRKFPAISSLRAMRLRNSRTQIDGLRLCARDSKQGSSITSYLRPNRRETGVLLGANDTVYFQIIPVQGTHQTIALWGDYPNDIGMDFDLYVRCGLPPTPTEWDFRGFLSIRMSSFTSTASLTALSLYVAVRSNVGAGMFSIMTNHHWTSQHHPAAHASVNYWATYQYYTWQTHLLRGFGISSGSLKVPFMLKSCTSGTATPEVAR